MIKRIFVEKKIGYNNGAIGLKNTLNTELSLKIEDIRVLIRYDVDKIDNDDFNASIDTIFSEPPVDNVYLEDFEYDKTSVLICSEFLPGQYDQRADSAAQCVSLLTKKAKPLIKCAMVYIIKGFLNENDIVAIKKYLINPIEAREAKLEKPTSLDLVSVNPTHKIVVDGFITFNENEIKNYHSELNLAMSVEDLLFVQKYFIKADRNPSITEIKVLDTYWSDHCRHTTFLTKLDKITIKSNNKDLKNSYNTYKDTFNEINKGKKGKYKCLMDLATIGAKKLKKDGYLKNIDISEEINACSIVVKVDVDGQMQDWLVMFKNETHNHPTEIEPFGGAATCLGGAIRDPLSGRSYVYQSMRITGAGDICVPLSNTLKGKLSQKVISTTAAKGFSSYGNQIGLATGLVQEIFHDNFVAKRMECGYVVGAAPLENVVREEPQTGDIVLLIGGDTGRDGIGGATGSSKVHTVGSVENCSAEVQKGNPLTERKIQRLFRKKEVTALIKRCNDFGAGGVCVAIGELSDGLDIYLDKIPKKYEGLSATEIAISESQERMAVVIKKTDLKMMTQYCHQENLKVTLVGKITGNKKMRMFYEDDIIVDLTRKLLSSNGVQQIASARIEESTTKYLIEPENDVQKLIKQNKYKDAVLILLSNKNVASQKGLSENFDSTVGSNSVLMPFGGKYQNTPALSMCAKVPMIESETNTATVSSFGYNADIMSKSPYTGSIYSVVTSVIKSVLTGSKPESIYLTFQEFFKKLNKDELRWGEPLSALLGAFTAQLELKMGAIGGKDSMSGSFENLDVPPTLISFALGIVDADKVITNDIKKSSENIYLIELKRNEYFTPDFDYLNKLLSTLYIAVQNNEISFANIVEIGGAVIACIKSALGSKIGLDFIDVNTSLFNNALGDIILSTSNIDRFSDFMPKLIAKTTQKNEFSISNSVIKIEDALDVFNAKYNKVYKQYLLDKKVENIETLEFTAINKVVYKKDKIKPTVFIPVFPGTNCEYDMQKQFLQAGANVNMFVVKNNSEKDIADSVKAIAKAIDEAQIIAFPGGFSGGDEPDGSGKFIATTFRNIAIEKSIDKLINARDGLILGICNGFQAIVKLGLLPNAKISTMTQDSPTLTFNDINRHVSTISRIKVASNLSPWFNNVAVGDEFNVAISHGEGKFVCNPEIMQQLIKNGQIATQYIDFNGNATMLEPCNPNGSMMAIEGITSRDGRILGKMGHSERIGNNLMKNIYGEFDMKIFKAGVDYFK